MKASEKKLRVVFCRSIIGRIALGLRMALFFPLVFCPERQDSPDFSGRKFAYSLSVLIVCDDQRLIRYYLAGWPGRHTTTASFEIQGLWTTQMITFLLRSTSLATRHMRHAGS